MRFIAYVNGLIWQLRWPYAIAAYLTVFGVFCLLVLFLAYQIFTWRAPTHEELWQVRRRLKQRLITAMTLRAQDCWASG